MAWKQVLSPNLDNDPKKPLYVYQGGKILTDWYGWCLAVVAASYGAKGSSYSAKTAWQACGTKHKDRNIPEGIYTPLWYEGGQYGHVVIGLRKGNNITIYSSPYTHKPNFEVFSGELNKMLNYIGQVYGVGSFSGWSETVLDSRVLKWEDDKPKETAPSEPVKEPSEDKNDDNVVVKPEPVSGGSDEQKDDDANSEDKEMEKNESQQIIGGILEEISEDFEPTKTMKLIAYIVGDALLLGALIVPDIIKAVQASNAEIFGEYLAKVLMELGTGILFVFKLLKKKK